MNQTMLTVAHVYIFNTFDRKSSYTILLGTASTQENCVARGITKIILLVLKKVNETFKIYTSFSKSSKYLLIRRM